MTTLLKYECGIGKASGIKKLHRCVHVDTLPLYRSLYPNLRKPGPGYFQTVLLRELLGVEYAVHDALEDVKALKQMVEQSKVADTVLYMHSSSLAWHIQDQTELPKLEAKNLPSFGKLVDNKILSRQMAKKIACSSLSFAHLKRAFERVGYSGIMDILIEDKPRVTSDRKVFRNVTSYFEK